MFAAGPPSYTSLFRQPLAACKLGLSLVVSSGLIRQLTWVRVPLELHPFSSPLNLGEHYLERGKKDWERKGFIWGEETETKALPRDISVS